MIKGYKEIVIDDFDDATIDTLYVNLLQDKCQFYILNFENKYHCLTKERTVFEIENKNDFLIDAENDVYYRTQILEKAVDIDKDDLRLFRDYISKYKNQFCCKKYGDKYLFGTIAVKTSKGFITTIRGKTDMNDFTSVESVNHKAHVVYVINKKATLNAPLLDWLLKNNKVKAVVHLHSFNKNLRYEKYAFPGTVKDSQRNNLNSFNIEYHGTMLLFDDYGNLI